VTLVNSWSRKQARISDFLFVFNFENGPYCQTNCRGIILKVLGLLPRSFLENLKIQRKRGYFGSACALLPTWRNPCGFAKESCILGRR
jgi:hypothetical protein